MQPEPQTVTIVLRRSGQSTTADPADLAAVRSFALGHGLKIDRESAAERSVRVSGTADQLKQAFGGDSRNDSTIPAALRGIAIAVLGLDQRAIAKSHGE
jgi:kumamolisin